MLIILSVGVTSVRAQDRLIYFSKSIGAFSYIQLHGLIRIQLTDLLLYSWISYLLQLYVLDLCTVVDTEKLSVILIFFRHKRGVKNVLVGVPVLLRTKVPKITGIFRSPTFVNVLQHEYKFRDRRLFELS